MLDLMDATSEYVIGTLEGCGLALPHNEECGANIAAATLSESFTLDERAGKGDSKKGPTQRRCQMRKKPAPGVRKESEVAGESAL